VYLLNADVSLSIGLQENYASWYASKKSATEAQIEQLYEYYEYMEKYYG